MVNLFDFSLIRPEIVQRTMWQLHMVKEDLEMTSAEATVKQEPVE